MSTPTRCVVCGTVEYWYHGVKMNQTPIKVLAAFPTTCPDCLREQDNYDD